MDVCLSEPENVVCVPIDLAASSQWVLLAVQYSRVPGTCSDLPGRPQTNDESVALEHQLGTGTPVPMDGPNHGLRGVRGAATSASSYGNRREP